LPSRRFGFPQEVTAHGIQKFTAPEYGFIAKIERKGQEDTFSLILLSEAAHENT
jgi:hypothetical protein